ncbi:T9SS type A sorting domain-containing protein [Puia sp. P3]|uniref:T9SS type A sorting domain-containing protein n=1 Tax=Puia sp. P3 TaxID=3423952 RepID=UPI003D675F4C
MTVNLNKNTSNDLGVTIVDLSGRVVLSSRVKGTGLFTVATAGLRHGMYILTIADAASGKKIAESKFIKK